MLENLSRASFNLLFGLFGRFLDIGDDENCVEYMEELDKVEEEDWSRLLGIFNEAACLPEDIFLPGDPLSLDEDLFLRMEWAMIPDPFPVYNLSPMDMVTTTWVSRLLSSSLQSLRVTGRLAGVAQGLASIMCMWEAFWNLAV